MGRTHGPISGGGNPGPKLFGKDDASSDDAALLQAGRGRSSSNDADSSALQELMYQFPA